MCELRDRLQAALQERYRVERELGRGGMGTVFLARDLRHDRPVAVKVLHPELATAVGARRFLAEIRLAANLAHPYIVTVFESGEAARLLYYVMPYVEGESLRERLERDGRLPVEEAVRVALDVAEALAFAHGRGVVHRDIKPENILLACHGHASVADFGVARALSSAADERLTATGLILGSPPYLSPEQAGQAAGVDGRADIYSLGCVLHEMLAGAPPFGTNGAQATIFRHLTEKPAPLRSLRPGVPPAVEAAVLKALEKEPPERFACAEELTAALAERAGAVRRWWRWGRRFRAPRGRRALGALGGVALAAALAVALFQNLSRPPGPVGVMVLPFDTPAEAGAAARLREEPSPDRWLASSLDLLPVVQVIDARASFAAERDWRAVPIEDVVRRARRGGAKYLITGSLLESGRERRLTVELYSARGGRRVYNSPILPGETHAQALDRMALEAVRVIAEAEGLDLGTFDAVAAATTSLTALTQLLEGQRRFWRGEMDAAVLAFHRAIAADSSFGPAYYRLSVAETWTPRYDYPAALAAAEAGLRWRDQMPPRWAELLAAQRHYARRNADSAQYQFQKVLGENPRLADALLGAGEVLFHQGGMLGESPGMALAPFEGLLAEDGAFAVVEHHVVDIALYLGDESLARRYLHRVEASRRPARAAAVALRFGDGKAKATALDSLRRLDRATISTVSALFIHQQIDPALADTVASFLTDPHRNTDDRVRGVHHRLAALAAQGRWADGVRLWDSIAGGRQFDAWIVHGYLAELPVRGRADPMFAWARAQVDSGRVTFKPLVRGEAKDLDLRDAFRALVHRAMLEGDSAEVGELLRRIAAAEHTADRSDPEPEALRASLLARLALLAGDTSGAIVQLERGVARAPWTPSPYIPLADAAPQRLLLARLRAARGDRRGAERMLHSFGRIWCVGDALFLPAVAKLRAGWSASPPRRNPSLPPRPATPSGR